MALLTVQQITAAGVVPQTPVAAAPGGDTFSNNGRTKLIIANGGGSGITVTISAQIACDMGTLHDITNSIAAGATEIMGPFSTRYNDSSGLVHVGYSAVTSVTVSPQSV